ncbi:MAG: hypothetical protein HYS75_04360 [Nitrosopumilales archaeon]|nr:hypothetical protein [Nitrosopumilales archaeon]
MKKTSFDSIRPTIIIIFLSGFGFLMIGESIDFQTLAIQNWGLVILGSVSLIATIPFIKTAQKLERNQSRVDASNDRASILPDDIAKDLAKKNRRFKL